MYHSLKRIWLSLFCLCLLGSVPVWAADDAGTSSATFLKIIPYPTAGAMGAYTACATGNEALYFNPAGLGATERPEVTMVHNDWFGLTDYEYLAFSCPVEVGEGGGLGASLSYLTTGDLLRTTVADPNGLNSGEFSASDMMFAIGYGQRIGEKFYIGGTYRYIRERIWSYSANASAFDIGVRVEPVERLHLGASIRFLGSDITLNQRGDDLPTTFSGGISYQFPILSNNLLIAVDAIKPNDEGTYGAIGAEYELGEFAVIRGGYSSKNDIGNGLTCGVGLRDGQNWFFDYSYTPQGDLGQTNRISLTYRH